MMAPIHEPAGITVYISECGRRGRQSLSPMS